MDKFNLDVSLVARVGGHSAPRTYRDPLLCIDSDGEEDCRKVRQGENDHQSTCDGVDHEWWCVFDECVDFRICCSECPFPIITVTGFIFRTVIFDQVIFTDFIFQSVNSE